jgi:hypothetical protein
VLQSFLLLALFLLTKLVFSLQVVLQETFPKSRQALRAHHSDLHGLPPSECLSQNSQMKEKLVVQFMFLVEVL